MNKEVHISVIHNWADGEKIYPVPPQKNLFIANNGYQNKFIVLYSGNFGMAHSFAIFLEAAQKLLTVPDIIFVFIGDGKQKDYIVRTVNEWGLSNVAIRYYEPPELLHYSLSSAHIGLISLARGLEGYIVPSKVYSMMAAGLSILYSGDSNSTVAKIIESAQCGYRVDQNDSEELVRHIYSQYNDRVLNDTLKKNARKYFEQHFERELAIEMYDATFRQILNDNGEKTYT
jgi:glycosyltransferase involved in cell wall biosynthesis